MKLYNIILLALVLINLVLANPIKKKCIVRNKPSNPSNGSIDNADNNTPIDPANEATNNESANNESSNNSANDTTSNTSDMNQYEIEHINTLDKYLAECTVLLRRNGDFPIGKKNKKIYLYGNGVRKTIKGGTGSGDVNSRSFDTIEQAFTKAGYEILTKDYLDEYDKIYEEAQTEFNNNLWKNSSGNFFAMMGAIMPEPDYDIPYEKEGDVAVFVLSRVSGEGSDRKPIKGDVYLTDTERKMVLDLAKGFKKFMLVLNTGGPVDLSGLEDVKNILVLSQLGVNTSKTLVDIIAGDKYPSGKLATTWTKYEDYPTNENFGDNDDTDYKEGVYVGYRYFDSVNADVMYPFGFGLGYTDFEFDVKSAKLVGEKFEVSVSVKNIGKFKGKEVLELYLSKPGTTIDEPYQILVNFAKTKELKPNKKQTLKLSFKLSDFASYDEKTATYILDKGKYVVRVGNSSRNTKPCGIIKVASKINVRKVANKLGKPEFKDFVPETKRKQEKLNGVKEFTLKTSSIKQETIDYDKKYEISEEVKALSNEEKAKLVIGAYKDGNESVIGNASITAAGAAGETARVADLKPVVMADGPAGLRLSKDYYIDESGAHGIGGYGQTETPKDVEILHQYTTAIPIGTAIAQSWNRKFAELCGDIVGSEMEIFKIQLWLAPALNIHRSILCGRNFEYYSEDPFISGAFASSITQGVQKHNNTYVTIKHFAANNQETNRYFSSSNASERALREIYLKGFEIAVKEANPKAIMTSYNLINGIHTSESKELTSDILRNEFGFDGIVMTDWVIKMGGNNKYSGPIATNVVKATGDIYMPGSKSDYENILESLDDGDLSVEELEISASRIYNLAKELEI
ncbi:beta-glucosidase-related glycosidase [Neocallimastix californiae]|uniref:beta-glucosidase n=1 Tax=Neocallimastix californiae TaxID=1754190 RepID=A0A1Y2FH82_9FUNG|nr:beta-glucosidase-related glycosidase [Neocallimastix californiae]|eukprot:ORY83321.1 beta-glucosidase-related glycosidase [Neocallimastix californiae]